MFEQESYNQEPTELHTEPGDLFHEYEIVNWNFSPRLYKILAISAVFNVLLIVGLGTSGILTARGCDSPFVGRVCQVLDTVYVGSLILGTERDYIDAPYDKTDLGDAEVTFVDVTGVTPPLSYPEGYFQLANPEQQFANVTDPMMASPGFLAPGIPSGNPTIGGSGLINTPPISPPKNRNAIQGKLPTGSPLDTSTDDPALAEVNGKPPRGGKPKPEKAEDANVAQAEEKDESTLDPNKQIETKNINRRPFVDLAGAVNSLLLNREVNLEAEFSVAAKGKLNKDGRLDKKTFKFTRAASSDPKLVNVVKQSIEAFSDSGILQYLEQLSGKDLDLAIAQDKEKISGEVRSDVERETRATSLAAGMRFFLGMEIDKKLKRVAELQAENNPEKAQDLQNTLDELELLQKTEIVAEGKQLVVKFSSPKGVMHNLINRKLDAQAKEIKKEGGTGPGGLNDNTAKKRD